MKKIFLFCAGALLLSACNAEQDREAKWAAACEKAGPAGSVTHTQCVDRQREAYYDKMDAMKDEYQQRREEEEWWQEQQRMRRF